MLQFEGKKGVEFCDGLTRRDFLRAGALGAGAVGLTLADLHRLGAAEAGKDVNCILLFLVGAPGQLDTWDLKPDAPSTVRGPFRPIQTNVPGVEICEHFPCTAKVADRYAVVRSVHHDAAPIHETGHQLMQTGRLFRGGREYPHYGAALSRLRGPRHEPFVVQGDPARTSLLAGVDAAHRTFDAAPRDDADGRAFGSLFGAKKAFDVGAEGSDVRARYGRNTFGQSCLLARRLVEHGVRLVTVNMFDTVFNEVTWDCHADGGALATRLDDYRDTLCPMFDLAYTALLEDLRQRGLLETTLVLAMGEFGRPPRGFSCGVRDHWPGVWSVLFAGAGVKGGQVVGSSDRTGAEPKDRPVTPAEVAATVYHALGVDLATRLPGPDGRPVPLADAGPISELFRS